MDFFSVVGSASKASGAFGGWGMRLLASGFSHQFLEVWLLWSYTAVEFLEPRLPQGLLKGRLGNTVNIFRGERDHSCIFRLK